MNTLQYYTSETVESLRNGIQDHLDWYYYNIGPTPHLLPVSGVRKSRLKVQSFASELVVDPDRPQKNDAENAITVYNTLRELTPHQSSLECLWVYLCHVVCATYVCKRWLSARPENNENAIRKVKNHYFASGTRSLIRDNGVSRLWWLGRTAHEVAPDKPDEFLQVLLAKQDVRSALLERPSISMNVRLLRGIYEILRENWYDGQELFDRVTFRSWMIALNRKGGVILLDALSDIELKRLLQLEAENAMSVNRSG